MIIHYDDLNERETLEIFNNAHKRLLQIEATKRIQTLLDEIKSIADEHGIGFLAMGLLDNDDPESVDIVTSFDYKHIMPIPNEDYFNEALDERFIF